MSASLATSRAGALERFHECLLSGASAEMRQDQVTHSRRMKSSSKQICAHAEEADTVSASSPCGQAEGKKVLVQVLSGTAPRGTIRGRLFNRGLVRKWARFLLLVWLIFFQHGAKSCRFSGLAFGCVFHARFWARLIDVCSQSTHFRGQNADSK